MKRLMLTVTALCAGMALAAPVYTVTLPNGVTNTLDEAFANGYVTSGAAEDTPSYAGLCAAADLQVAGGGRLEIDKDLKSAGYTGEVHVVAGAILRLTANGALGDTAHGTFVADGATLENECLDTSANSKLDFDKEHLTFAGTGVDGLGALVARTPEKQERNGVWGGTDLTMTGDATIATANGYQDFPNNSKANSLDMNGHTLTVRGIPNAKGVYPGNVCLRPVVTNPGHIVITNCGASINDYAKLPGGADHKLTLAANSSLELYSNSTVGQKTWTLSIPNSNPVSLPLKTSSDGGVWDGPIVADRHLQVYLSSQAVGSSTNINNSIFSGKLTIEGAFSFANGSSTIGVPTLTLASPENDFRNPLFEVGSNTRLKLPVDGTLACCATVNVNAAGSVLLDENVRYEHLPVFKVVDRGVLSGAREGFWTGVEKNGSGELALGGTMDIGDLALNAGTVTMSAPRESAVGIWEGHKVYAYWHKDGKAGVIENFRANSHCESDDNCHSNRIVRGLRLAYESETYTETVPNENGTLVTGNGVAVSYRGYIWNPDPTNVTWTFAGAENTVTRLYINGNDVYGRQATSQVLFGNATLKPGANDFWWRIGVSGRTVGPWSSVNNCETWTDKTKMGLAVDRLGRNSREPNDYERLDNLDGTLFFTLDLASTEFAELATTHVGCLSGVNDAVLNAQGRRLVVDSLVGCPTVNFAANGPDWEGLVVTNRLTAKVADVVAGRKLTVDGKLTLGPDAVIAFDGIGKFMKGGVSYPIVTATGGITGVPQVAAEEAANYRLTLSADGKTLSAEYQHPGLLLFIR